MTTYIVRRVLQGLVVVWLVSVLTFFLINLAPGGPSSLVDMNTTAAQREARLRQYGLDKPVVIRYRDWLVGTVQGDLGTSINGGLEVSQLLRERLGRTLILGLSALVLAAVLGVLLGVAAALNANRILDHIVSLISTLGMSVPNFWLGILLIIIFSVTLGSLPATGMPSSRDASWLTWIQHLILPVSVLAFSLLPNVVRITRASFLEVLSSDYIRTASAKGLRRQLVLTKHAMKNALVPVIAILGLISAVLLSGSVVIENVFGYAGLGRLAVDAARGRDYPVIMGVTLLAGTVVVIVNLLTDVLYAVIDPRIRHDH
ncbi:MAG: ABC transporter permease [Deinococcota bacterium]